MAVSGSLAQKAIAESLKVILDLIRRPVEKLWECRLTGINKLAFPPIIIGEKLLKIWEKFIFRAFRIVE